LIFTGGKKTSAAPLRHQRVLLVKAIAITSVKMPSPQNRTTGISEINP
jgi:hypothetical protein